MTVAQRPAFNVMGIEARTTNEREMNGQGSIGTLWARFYAEKVGTRIPNRADESTVVVYTDYESDENGAYTVVIGAQVLSVDPIPAGMTWRSVPAGRYAVFEANEGPVAETVMEAWRRVWIELPASGSRRTYRADVEVYEGSAPPKLYIGI
jgi:predicted transcriptional regulator YdeE